MRTSSIFLPIFLVAVLVGFWFWRTHELKTFVESKIKDIEEHQGDNYTFKHGGIESRGFPLRSEVAVKYPRITFNDEVGVNEIFLDGDLILGTSWMGSEMWFRQTGTTHALAANDDGSNPKTTDHWLISGDTTLTFSPSDIGLFKVIPESFRTNDGKAILNDIARRGQFHAENLHVKNALHGGTVNMADVVNLEDATHLLDFKNLNAGWKNSSKDKDIDQFVFSADAQYENALLNQLKKEDAKLPDLGLFKFDLQGSVTYDKNLDLDNIEQLFESTQTKPFAFEITRLSSSNNYDKSISSLALRTTPYEKHKVDMHFEAKNDATLSKEGYQVTVYEIQKLLENARENVPEDQKELYAKLPALVADIFPRYYELGKVNTNIDLNLDFGGGLIPFMLNNFDLRHFDWTSPLYGVRVNGSFRGPMEGFLGSANVNIDNYRHLIESLASYYNSVLKSLSKAFGEEKINQYARQVPPELVERLIAFLKKISNNPASNEKDIAITITHSSDGLKIGTLPAEEVAAEGDQLFKDFEAAIRGNQKAQAVAPEPKVLAPAK